MGRDLLGMVVVVGWGCCFLKAAVIRRKLSGAD